MAGEGAAMRGRLTRTSILEAALASIDDHGLERFSMRLLANDLGVEAMSLYNHIPDKEAILAGVAEIVLEEVEVPLADAQWEKGLHGFARSLRQVIHAHPNAAPLLFGRVPAGPAAYRGAESVLEILRTAGFDEELSMHCLLAVIGYVLEDARLEMARPLGGSSHPEGPLLDPESIPRDEFPRLAELASYLARRDPEEAFVTGLELVLAGVTVRLQAKIAAKG